MELTATKPDARAEVELRAPTPADAGECGRVTYEAFKDVAERHGFPPDFASLEAASGLAESFIAHPSIFGVVAVLDGRIVGSNFIDERDPIRGIGPLAIEPAFQDCGIGRRLMEAVIERGGDAERIHLQEDAYNSRAMALYASLGFEIKHPTVLIAGTPRSEPAPGWEVRPLEHDDLGACDELCRATHGNDRANALRDAMEAFAPHVATRDGRVVAYAATLSFWPLVHAASETPDDLRALIAGTAASTGEGVEFLLPTRHAPELFRWCLAEGLRVVKPMNLMALGEYHEPRAGCWIPSVLY